jgi:hypothetical protein
VRRERPEQDVVEAVILAGALDRLEVEGLLDDADPAAVPLLVGAVAAGMAAARGAASVAGTLRR